MCAVTKLRSRKQKVSTDRTSQIDGDLPIRPEPASEYERPHRSGEGMDSVLAHLRDHLLRRDLAAGRPEGADAPD